MRLLITGGTGFFGRALIKHLESERKASGGLLFENVTVLSRSPKEFSVRHPVLASLPWLQWHSGDVLRLESLPLQRFSHILHAASDSTEAAGLTPLDRYRQIALGTENMLKFAVQSGAERFLLTSSGGVYGPQPVEMAQIYENFCGIPDPLQSSSTYGLGKRIAEHLCFLYGQTYGIEIVIARCFAFVGQDLPLDAHFAIGNFIRDALQKTYIEVGGDGTPVRTYMDQRDLSHWLMTLLERGRSGQAYNVGSDAEITIRDLALLVRDTLAPDKPVNIARKITAQSNRNRYVPSITKARTELGLSLQHSLEEAILESVGAARR